MGQYYLTVCMDKKEFIYPLNFGAYKKEIEYISSSLYGKAIMYLLSKSSSNDIGDITDYQGEKPDYKGRWSGCGIRTIGHYDKSNLYKRAKDRYINISIYIVGEMLSIDGLLLPREIEILLDHYAGDEYKSFRQRMHIAHTYSKRMWSQ